MIIHEEAKHRFIIQKSEGLCYLEYDLEGSVCTVLHTVVPEALSGQGLAGKLAAAFYDWATSQGYHIQSDCSYMTGWMKRKGLGNG